MDSMKRDNKEVQERLTALQKEKDQVKTTAFTKKKADCITKRNFLGLKIENS